MNELFQDSLEEINSFKRKAHFAYIALSAGRALATASIVSSLWFIVEPTRPLSGIMLGGLSFLLLMSFTSYKKKHHVDENDFILSLDMNHQNSTTSPFLASTSEDAVIAADWKPRLQREVRRNRAVETRRLTAMSSSITIPALAALLLWFKAPPSFTNVLAEAQDVMSIFEAEKNLEVLTGAIDPKDLGRVISLGGKAPTLKLMPQNMLRFTYNTGRRRNNEEPPSIILTPKAEDPTKTIPAFQMQGRFDQEGNPAGWAIDFSVNETSTLSLKSALGSTLATFEVEKLPLPEVELSLQTTPQDPWPDNVSVPFNIKITAHNPLRKVQLIIKSRSKTATEMVTSVYGESTTELVTSYKLNLEPYMSEDTAEFEITAEATDTAQPTPLTGVSQPILIRAASAYGRYKETLNTLSKVRSSLEDLVSNAKGDISQESLKLMDQASVQAENSPFFDTIDRMNITKFQDSMRRIQNSEAKAKAAKVIELNNDLSEFLFEHESLDDRERDRDFFIASRTLSRVLEKPRSSRPVDVSQLHRQLKTFLDQRMRRWKLRIEHLPENSRPTTWSRIRDQKPFHQGVDDTISMDTQGKPSESQSALAKTTNFYKSWLDELEAKEDEYRQKRERDQQQNLSNARNELRELQQRQDQISSALDRASTRPQDELNLKWQSARPQQNSNLKQAKDLLEQLRSVSPESGERLSAALTAMDETIHRGNKSEFQEAESASDAAGRLLRDAEQSAAKRQQQQSGRGRRKRAAGDDYYGNSVIQGDVEIKTEYQVDARYREDILKDVDQSGDTAAERSLLDNYLREVLR